MAIIDVIKFNGIKSRDWLVYHYPGNSFVYGAQLIVSEGQIAVFVKGGKALDYFSAGTYTLESSNISILQSLINIPFGGKTPFSAEVYFINKAVKLDLYWGTSDPISLIDPKYNVRLRVRAFGQLGIRIANYRVFLTELIGAVGDNDIVRFDIVTSYFKGMLVTKIKTIIADIVINQKISVLEIAPRLEDVSKISSQRLSGEFSRFGIEIINFFISSVDFPDEDFEIINKILNEKAEFELIGDKRYNVKRSYDVMETAAGNEGNGGIASAGMGLGLGAGAGLAMTRNFSDNFPNEVSTAPPKLKCKKCGTVNEADMVFCLNCGGKLKTEKIPCYACNKLIDEDAKFCPYCGASMKKKICSKCKTENAPDTKFCIQCGNSLAE